MIQNRSELDVLYPNPTRTCKFTRMRPKRCYKRKPKSEKPDPNANGYPNAQA